MEEILAARAAGHDILIVEDDDDTRSLMCEGLRKRGFEVEGLDSAAACLSRLNRAPAAVVVTDVQMPGMSGIELCGKLRALCPEVPVIVMSGLKSRATASAALIMGAVTFLAKPVSLEALAGALRHALQSP